MKIYNRISDENRKLILEKAFGEGDKVLTEFYGIIEPKNMDYIFWGTYATLKIMYCYVRVTEHSVKIAILNEFDTRVVMSIKEIPYSSITKMKFKNGILGRKIYHITAENQKIKMVIPTMIATNKLTGQKEASMEFKKLLEKKSINQR